MTSCAEGGGEVHEKVMFVRFLMTKGGRGVSQKVTMHDINREGVGGGGGGGLTNTQQRPYAVSLNV